MSEPAQALTSMADATEDAPDNWRKAGDLAPSTKTQPADPYIELIERVATDPNASLDKLERMLELRDREDSKRSKRLFNDAFAKCQREIPTVIRNRDNNHTKSTYADLAAIEKAVMPVVHGNGFSIRMYPKPGAAEGFQALGCVVSHVDGHEETYEAEVPLDGVGAKGNSNKTATHAFGSTITYGRRYLLCSIFNIATADDDGNAGSVRDPINAEQFVTLRDTIATIGLDEKIILDAEKIDALEELPKDRFAHVKNQLEITAKKRGVEL